MCVSRLAIVCVALVASPGCAVKPAATVAGDDIDQRAIESLFAELRDDGRRSPRAHPGAQSGSSVDCPSASPAVNRGHETTGCGPYLGSDGSVHCRNTEPRLLPVSRSHRQR